ncbi:MAG: CPP1-like family protein [Cyanobacteriota bacterium]|nr:CPP1-like family protein [Cyanobacteriota bacterium]
MTQTPDSSPYERLGVQPDASFDVVQAAKQARLAETGDDPLARAKVEAAYDAVLMERLKDRQQGKVSTAARSASQREQITPPPRPAALPTLPQVTLPKLGSPALAWPELGLTEGFGLWFPLAGIGGLTLLALLLPQAPGDLLLSLAVLASVVSLQRRSGRFLAAAGWSLALLVVGLVSGALLVSALSTAWPSGDFALTRLQVESLPAFLLLLAGALLIG